MTAILLIMAGAALAAPPGDLSLAVVAGEPIGGQTFTLGVRGADPGASVVVAFSDGTPSEDAGLCPPQLAGDCLDFAPGPMGTRTVVATADGRGDARFEIPVPKLPPRSDFVLQAATEAPNTSNVLELHVDACGFDAQEPNQSELEATPLEPSVDADVCSGVDEDWYTFSLGPLTFLEVEATYDVLDGDVDFELYDADLVELDASRRNDGFEQLTYFNNTGATLTLFVRAHTFFDEGDDGIPYTLLTEVQTTMVCYEDAAEDNDNWSAAYTLDAGLSFDAQACDGDDDWYTFAVEAGDQVDVTLAVDDTWGDVAVRLYDRSLDRVAQGDDSASYVSPRAQNMYAEVVLLSDDAFGGGNNYTITVTAQAP